MTPTARGTTTYATALARSALMPKKSSEGATRERMEGAMVMRLSFQSGVIIYYYKPIGPSALIIV
jgi:hypothetical protein